MRAKVSGSHRRSQASLVIVKLATGTLPQAAAQASAPERVDQGGGVGGRLGVVPELGRAEDRTGRVQHHQPVLLAADGDGGRSFDTRLGPRGFEGGPPGGRVLFAAGRRRRRVGRPARRDQLTRVGVPDLDLAGRRRGVDPDDERHYPRLRFRSGGSSRGGPRTGAART